MLHALMQIGVLLFMIGSLAGVGLRVVPRDVIRPLQHGRFLAICLVTCWLVCPVVAMVTLWVVPLAQPYAAGLLLLSLAPCAPFAPAMVRTARGDTSYLAAFMVFSTVTTVIFMPVGVPLLLGVSISPWRIARPLLSFVLVPLVIGMTVSELYPRAAAWLRPKVERVTAASALVMFVPIVVLYGRGVVSAVGERAILAQVMFLLAITIVTHVLGSPLRGDQRSVVTLGICTRNLGAALAPISAVAEDDRGVVMIAIGAIATLVWSAIVARRLARGGPSPTMAFERTR